MLGGSKVYDGGIYVISWSFDSIYLFFVFGDKIFKIWDVSVNFVVSIFFMGFMVLD